MITRPGQATCAIQTATLTSSCIFFKTWLALDGSRRAIPESTAEPTVTTAITRTNFGFPGHNISIVTAVRAPPEIGTLRLVRM